MSALEWLDEAEQLAAAATEGPWASWFDQDGATHMNGLLMVGNAAAVIPDGETWVEGVDVNPIAHTYTPEDREFIARSRTLLPQATKALWDVLAIHKPFEWSFGYGPVQSCRHCAKMGASEAQALWPCPTVRAITEALAS